MREKGSARKSSYCCGWGRPAGTMNEEISTIQSWRNDHGRERTSRRQLDFIKCWQVLPMSACQIAVVRQRYIFSQDFAKFFLEDCLIPKQSNFLLPCKLVDPQNMLGTITVVFKCNYSKEPFLIVDTITVCGNCTFGKSEGHQLQWFLHSSCPLFRSGYCKETRMPNSK